MNVDDETRQLGRPLLSVVLSTCNRADILRDTLLNMQSQSPDVSWELIVVDNGSTDNTNEVLTSMSRVLPLRRLYEGIPGKSRAINLALGTARGRLVVFTDDDIRPHPQWLTEYERAFNHYAADIFCGPITGLFPAGAPKWLTACPLASPLFAEFAPLSFEGHLPSAILPYGGNFAVRRELLKSIELDERLGPPHLIMGEDTAFLLRLRALSQDIVYIPSAGVDHYIRPEQLLVSNIIERAFTCGTSMVEVMDTTDIVAPLSRTAESAARLFDIAANLNYSYGQMFALSANEKDPRITVLVRHVASLKWAGDSRLLATRARSWLNQNVQLVPSEARSAFCPTALSQITPRLSNCLAETGVM